MYVHGMKSDSGSMATMWRVLSVVIIASCLVFSSGQQTECATANMADIMFLVGTSPNSRPSDFQDMKNFLRGFVESLEIGPNKVQVGLVQIGDDSHQEFLLKDNRDQTALLENLDRLRQRAGSANIGKALQLIKTRYMAKAAGNRSPMVVPQVVIVVTDRSSEDEADDIAKDLRRQGAFIYVVTVGVTDTKELQKISNSPHEHFLLSAQSYGSLKMMKDKLLHVVCSSVEYLMEALAPRCTDIVFLMDGTISIPQYQQVRMLLTRLVNSLTGSADHHIALVQFSDKPRPDFPLNSLEEFGKFLKSQLRPLRSTTSNLSNALTYVSDHFFMPVVGEVLRKREGMFLVVISTGKFQDKFDSKVKSLKDKGVTIISIGFDTANEQTLKAISTDSNMHLMTRPNLSLELKRTIEIKETLMKSQTASECSSARLADIVFIVEFGRDKKEFNDVRNFIHQIVGGLNVSSSEVRVGILGYGNTPKDLVSLSTFNEKEDILQYIKVLPYHSSTASNVGRALEYAKSNMFTAKAGSRKKDGVQQLAIVVMRGTSQDEVDIAASNLRFSGVTVYAVGMQDTSNILLELIASSPASKFVFTVDSITQLNTLQSTLMKFLCYTIIDTIYSSPRRRFQLKKACTQTEEADIYFLIDQSGSINPPDFKEMKDFVSEFIKMFKIGPDQVRIGLVKYADNPITEFELTRYADKQEMQTAVQQVHQVGGGTETGKALSSMSALFQKAAETRGEKVPQILITITDGKSADSVIDPAQGLKDQGITSYAIGIKEADEKQLSEIATSEDKKFFINNFNALRPIKDHVVRDICSQEACKEVVADIMFLIDSSGSIRPEDYNKMKAFMVSIVNKSDIGQGKVHLGVVQYSDRPELIFDQNTFYDKASIRTAINQMKQLGYGTLTGAALTDLSQYFENPRKGVKQILIVITDGEAQDDVKIPAEALRDKGINIFCIGVAAADLTQLMEITGSRDTVFFEKDFDALKLLENKILVGICEKTECKTEVADIMFMIDSSTSISDDQFQSMLTFMMSLINDTDVGANRVRIGAIMYANNPQLLFNMVKHTSKTAVRSALSALRRSEGSTYTSKALLFSKEYFGKEHGGRRDDGIPQILMVITDGEATDAVDLPVASKGVLDAGINVYAVGVKGAKQSELETMTGNKSKVYKVNNYDALRGIKKTLSQAICNISKPECTLIKGDLVMLIDGSESISHKNFMITKNFTANLVSKLVISQDRWRIGLAQFSSTAQAEFYLNKHYTEGAVINAIKAVEQLEEGTKLEKALEFVATFFTASAGSRIDQRVPQNLLVITDGDSHDKYWIAAEKLKAKGIHIIVIGIGKFDGEGRLRLRQISSNNRIHFVEDFPDLEMQKVITHVFDDLCTEVPDTSPSCTMDIAFGFDISTRFAGSEFFSGFAGIQIHLADIVRAMTSPQSLCCLTGDDKLLPHVGFRLVGGDGGIVVDYNFESFNAEVLQKLLEVQYSGTTSFNRQMLQSLQQKLSESKAGVKVMVIFSDGLGPTDDTLEELRKESERLSTEGIHGLLVVALGNVQDSLQQLEFGRGFEYRLQLSINMQNVASTLREQVLAVAARQCCSVMCQCVGLEGSRGHTGSAGTKGSLGLKGYAGYPGEEGPMGDRGRPGLPGPPGLHGCQGKSGAKGKAGFRGTRGDTGENGLDGIPGEQGTAGSAGEKGERGDSGSPGYQGTPGEPGAKGRPGLRGDPGEPGTPNNVPGAKGDIGYPGLQGDVGVTGEPGDLGSPGNPGLGGRRGQPGSPGAPGNPGATGPLGTPGSPGPQGQRGNSGPPGPKGVIGLPGPQGPPGTLGEKGRHGPPGLKGTKGQMGDMGLKGEPGPAGLRGSPGQDGTDGYGEPGPNGLKGESGFPGYPGLPGEIGFHGTKGNPGLKGNRGRPGNAGMPGETGDRGSPGSPGWKGPGGITGRRQRSTCDLVTYVQDNCACSHCRLSCPPYPTELVIALDMSQDVTNVDFRRMNETVETLLDGVAIAESNCPMGARVAIVSYNTNTKYHVRFSDYHSRQRLMNAIWNIPYVRSSNVRDIGAAMRFVARNVFKRTRQATLMRKVAVFITGGTSRDTVALNTGVLELRAMDISTAVVALKPVPEVRRAFEVDDSGTFMLTVLDKNLEVKRQLETIKNCIICLDPCRPGSECRVGNTAPIDNMDMDLALLMDSSSSVQSNQYHGVQQLLGWVVDQIVISNQTRRPDRAARVALVQQGISSHLHVGENPVHVEFDFTHHSSDMKRYITQMRQVGGRGALGHAVEWITQNLLLSDPRKNKVIIAVVGRDGSYLDQEKLEMVSMQAKCQNWILLTLTVGMEFNCTQVEELASEPIEQHIIHLGQVKAAELQYAQRFLRTFFQILKRGFNKYQTPRLQQTCRRLRPTVAISEAARGPPVESFVVPSSIERELIEQGPAVEDYADESHTNNDSTKAEVIEEAAETEYGATSGLSAICFLPMETGGCQNYTLKWYFDSSKKECSRFWFGGCDGNDNKFESWEKCEATCMKK